MTNADTTKREQMIKQNFKKPATDPKFNGHQTQLGAHFFFSLEIEWTDFPISKAVGLLVGFGKSIFDFEKTSASLMFGDVFKKSAKPSEFSFERFRGKC